MTRYGAEARALWPLDPEIVYLNHGGYGVTPHAILAEQSAWRARIEANPTRFMTRVYPTAVREAAAALAAFVGAAADNLVFVENATSGCNAVLRSLAFKTGDEILIANLAYGAVMKAARYVAANSGAKLVTVDLSVPLDGDDAAVDAIAAGLSPRTKLVILDHIVSATGVVLPVRRMADLAHAAGARVLIDGAHAPGNIPLDVPRCGVDWYVGNCHKWLFAPRACGFLWSADDARDLIHPLAISHGYGAGMLAEFDWTGTRDPSAILSVPSAIAFHEELGGQALMARNAVLAVETAQGFARAWGTNL